MIPLMLACALLGAPVGAPSLLVWDVEADAVVPPQLSRVLVETVTQAARDSSHYARVQSRQDVADVLGTVPPASLFNCVECVAALQQSLEVDEVVATKVVVLDGRHVVTMKLIRVKDAAVVASVTQWLPAMDGHRLQESMRPILARLLFQQQLREMEDVMDAPPQPAG